ncbi:RidA family protein [Peribacillus cavernae]|uniref:RidA family protein n=1 Tax=Peribacillus cavernae TaxID=1674310 RepID=A0A3S0TX33_9BACI|nr:RidA family protein [Peribacillus cavernae]MDQ0219775.1 enamine deaminase RidA (YjgF/YER057c/UK114 family) [Peribacillus cavernae]RUQ25190.1 RidA family protein [Peribacillus cavernae]
MIEKKLQELGYDLPTAPQPLANYVTVNRTGNLLFTSGQGCFRNGKPVYQGKLGQDISVEQGYDAARITAINLLSVVKAELGDLSKIKKVVKLLGFVSSTSDFYDHPQVINGASDFLVEVLGEKGKHARSAIGTNVLPMNLPVEIEMVIEIEE